MAFVRIGRWVINTDVAHERTGLEESFILEGEAAELFRQWLAARTTPWIPVRPGPHPRGPLGDSRFGRHT